MRGGPELFSGIWGSDRDVTKGNFLHSPSPSHIVLGWLPTVRVYALIPACAVLQESGRRLSRSCSKQVFQCRGRADGVQQLLQGASVHIGDTLNAKGVFCFGVAAAKVYGPVGPAPETLRMPRQGR